MKKLSSWGVSLLCVGAALVAALAWGEESGAAALDGRWMAAMKANDSAAVAACYAVNAVLWLPDTPEARGDQAIRRAYDDFLGAMTVKDVGIDDSHYETSGDLSAGWGRFTLTLQPKKGGDPVVMKGRFNEVAKRVGGRWLYVADHASAEPSPPPPAKP